MSGKEGEVPAVDKFDQVLDMLTKMNAELTKVKAESAEVRSLLNSNSKSAEDKEEDKKSSHNPKSKDSLEDEEEEKLQVDQEAMELMERLYSEETETVINEDTGEPFRVVIEDHVDFNTSGFPIAIKKEMMTKLKNNQDHNDKVEKVKILMAKQMKVRDS